MIRPYHDNDADAVGATWRAASDLAHPFLTKEFQDEEAGNVRNVYPNFAKIWVKELDGAIVGFIAVIETEIGAIFVAPDHHGKGCGRELMDFAVQKYRDVTLDVFEKNKIGRRFYDAYGFKQVDAYVHEPTGQMTLKLAYSLT